MAYCEVCGTKLEKKTNNQNEIFPFCPKCQCFRYEKLNVAVSMVVVTQDMKKTLLIEQYGSKRNILVAGYLNPKESAEDACRRELFEETHLTILSLSFQKSKYYAKTDTLMLNFVVIVNDDQVIPNSEIDQYQWFTLDEAKEQIAEGSLAEEFYLMFYNRCKNEL